MSIISAVKTYIQTYTGLEADAPVWVNYLREEPVDYSIVPIGGTRVVSQYVHGNSGEREFVFAFQSDRFTADEAERVGNTEFFEEFADWLDDQSDAGILPTLAEGLNVKSIEALGFGFLFEQGESSTGIYQIQCRLNYAKSK